MNIDDKRFRMPGFTIKSTCPKCQEEVTFDLGVAYMSYPKANEPIDFVCWHECEDGTDSEWPVQEWTVQIQIDLSIRALADCAVIKEEK